MWRRPPFAILLRFKTTQTVMFGIFKLDDLIRSQKDFLYQISVFSSSLHSKSSYGLEEKHKENIYQ